MPTLYRIFGLLPCFLCMNANLANTRKRIVLFLTFNYFQPALQLA